MCKAKSAAWLFAIALFVCRFLPAQSPAVAGGQSAESAQTSSELPAGPIQEKANTACTECHEARIIVQQRLSKAAWTKEVDKMVKWGAVVDPKDRDALIDYLSVNFGTGKPAYVPERSTTGAAASKK